MIAIPMERFRVSERTPLLGEVLTWTCGRAVVRYPELITALRESSLEESVARELAPKHAFTRACKKLSDRRIIRQVAEDATTVQFQFTAESREGDRYEYALETMLTLHKQTGTVTCPQPGLATLAQEELDRCIAVRTGADLTRVVQRLFERHADLFPIRPQGGAYFCPAAHRDFVDRVEGLLGRVHGQLLRFPVPAGTEAGDRSVTRAVAEGLAALIAEHQAAVDRFGSDTRADTLQRAAEKIRATKFKLSAYAEYLVGEKERLERAITAAEYDLRSKFESLTAEAVAS